MPERHMAPQDQVHAKSMRTGIQGETRKVGGTMDLVDEPKIIDAVATLPLLATLETRP